MTLLDDQIKRHAIQLGFDAVGIARAEPGQHLPFYLDWLNAGYHAGQVYLARPDRLARREDLQVILPGVRSLVVVGLDYWPGPPISEASHAGRGRISCYAQARDYHRVMIPMLDALYAFIQSKTGQVGGRAYVDTGALLERDHGLAAGLGFFGKNCNLIRPRGGSWFFLGVLMITIDLEPDQEPVMPSCGTCTRCLDACPTGALVEPYTLDSHLCISYLTTAIRGSIPQDSRKSVGNWIYGCDVCQSACPWNRFSQITLWPDPVDGAPSLLSLMRLSEAEFNHRYHHTPIGHIGRERFLRNVAVAIGNWSAPQAVPVLSLALNDPSSLVREHVAWALGQTGTPQARAVLTEALPAEHTPAVQKEIQLALRDGHWAP